MSMSHATATTAAMSAEGKDDNERLHLSTKEFAEQISLLAADVRHLVRMAKKLGKSGPVTLADGSSFGSKELNQLVSEHVKTLRQFKKNYLARGRRKRRAPRADGEEDSTRRGTFQDPSLITPELVNFLRTANFGNATGTNTPLNTLFEELLTNQIFSRAIMTPLMSIYAERNNLRFEEVDAATGKTHKFYRVNPELERAFGPWIAQAERDDAALTDAQLVDKKGNAKPRFRRNKFVYNRLQTIVKPGIRKKDDLSEAEQVYLKNQAVKDAVKDVQAVVSNTNDALKQ